MKKTNSVKGQRSLIQRIALAPYSVWALLFIVVPLIFIAYYAFTDLDYHFTTENITRFFTTTSLVADGEGTREVRAFYRANGLEAALQRYCGLRPGDGVFELVAGGGGQKP